MLVIRKREPASVRWQQSQNVIVSPVGAAAYEQLA